MPRQLICLCVTRSHSASVSNIQRVDSTRFLISDVKLLFDKKWRISISILMHQCLHGHIWLNQNELSHQLKILIIRTLFSMWNNVKNFSHKVDAICLHTNIFFLTASSLLFSADKMGRCVCIETQLEWHSARIPA